MAYHFKRRLSGLWVFIALVLCQGKVQAQDITAPEQSAVDAEKAQMLRDRAVSLARHGAPAQALAMIEQAYRDYPDDINVLADYLVILAWNDRFYDAVTFYEVNAYKNLPDYVLPEIARAYRLTGQHPQAVTLYEKYQKAHPDDQDAFLGLVYALCESGQNIRARTLLHKEIARYPEKTEYRLRMADTYWNEGDLRGLFTYLGGLNERFHDKALDYVQTIENDLSQAQRKDIRRLLKDKTDYQSFSYIEIYFLVQWLKETEGEGLMEQFKDGLDVDFSKFPLEIQLELAGLHAQRGFKKEAEKHYRKILEQYPENQRAGMWMARNFYQKEEYEQALELTERVLDNEPRHIDALFLRGEIFEIQDEFIRAVQVYDRIQRYYPDNQAAVDLKNRALMDLGANSLALDNLQEQDQPDPVLLQRAKGNQAMHAIRWEEAQKALDILEEESAVYSSELKDAGRAAGKTQDSPKDKSGEVSRALDQWQNAGEKTEPETKAPEGEMADIVQKIEKHAEAVIEPFRTQHYWRTRWDKILALRQEKQMKAVIREYEAILDEGADIPAWIHQAAGDAYLYEQKPQRALELYQMALRDQPEEHNTRMAVYHALVELGRFKEAHKVIDALDRETPVRVVERGILQDNWKKAEIAFNKAWLLLYQDRQAEAEKYLKGIMKISPFNTNLRTALAQTHYYRGWPRKALEEFEVIHTMDPDNVVALNGYSMVLNANMQEQKARELNEEMLVRHPKNKHVRRLRRQFDTEEMTALTLDTYYVQEFPGVDEFFISARADEPLNFHHTLFGQVLRRQTVQEGEDDVLNRFFIGDIWQPDSVWRLTGAMSSDYDPAGHWGWSLNARMTPDDFWTFSLGYDSYVYDIPVRSREEGTDVSRYTASAVLRTSELFNSAVALTLDDYDDGNEAMAYLWRTDTSLYRQAYWKLRLGTEFYAGTNSKTDNTYFSPEVLYSFYVVPMIEHTWYRRYEKAMVDRLFVGLGQQWQQEFGAENVGYVRYEQDYSFSDRLKWLVGMIYRLRNYDGEDVNTWNIYSTLRTSF